MSSYLAAQRLGARAAVSLRRQLALPFSAPCCPYDIAERLGIQVRFMDLPSMEGMYSPQPSPTILISALRPAPRRNFTCAHELGHHAFGHSHRVTPTSKPHGARCARYSVEEAMVDRFAAELLMPSLGIRHAFAVRGLNPQDCDAEGIYRVACQFAVGYATLSRTHLRNLRHRLE